MIHTIAIDPGKHSQAVAIFADGELGALFASETIPPPDWRKLFSGSALEIVIEIPQKDRRTVGGVVSDVIDVTAAGFLYTGEIRGAVGYGNVTTRTPQQWKHSIEKPIHHRSALARLTSAELAIVQSAFFRCAGKSGVGEYVATACRKNAIRKSKRIVAYSNPIHNLLDALTLGLTFLGRFERFSPSPNFKSRRSL